MQSQLLLDTAAKVRTASHTGNHRPLSRIDERVAGFSCLRCDKHYPASMLIDSSGCPACAEIAPANLLPIYQNKAGALGAVSVSPHSLWRYAAQLPCAAEDAVSLGEGITPLLPAPHIGELLGTPNLIIKDESRNPTWSYKDRFSTVAVSIARAQGHRVLATASSGNAGASLAAYAARAGLPCVVATFAHAAGPMLAQIRKYGATVLPLVNKTDRWTLLAQAAARHGWFITSPYRAPVVGSHPLGIEGYKTIAYEIVDQSGGVAPDWVVMPVCYGDALSGVWAGFKDMHARGVIEQLPRLLAAEVHGSLADALARGVDCLSEQELPFESLAASIGTPRSTYQALKALRDSSGHAVCVVNDGLIEMQAELARREGVLAELASVTPLIAIRKAHEAGMIASGDRVIAVATAGGLKDLDRSDQGLGTQSAFATTDDAWTWLKARGAHLLA